MKSETRCEHDPRAARVAAALTGRWKLASLSVLALIGDLTAVVSIDKFPTSGFGAFSYLDGIWWVLGPMTYAVVVWAIVEAIRSLLPRLVPAVRSGGLAASLGLVLGWRWGDWRSRPWSV